jgi:hypothetical protein
MYQILVFKRNGPLIGYHFHFMCFFKTRHDFETQFRQIKQFNLSINYALLSMASDLISLFLIFEFLINVIPTVVRNLFIPIDMANSRDKLLFKVDNKKLYIFSIVIYTRIEPIRKLRNRIF